MIKQQNGAADSSPWQVVVDSTEPLERGDLEAAMAYWADDASVRLIGVPSGEPDTFDGKEQVRGWMSALLAGHFMIKEELLAADGDKLTTRAHSWSDSTRALGVAPLEATENYVVRDGKIKSLVWTIAAESSARLLAALAAAKR